MTATPPGTTTSLQLPRETILDTNVTKPTIEGLDALTDHLKSVEPSTESLPHVDLFLDDIQARLAKIETARATNTSSIAATRMAHRNKINSTHVGYASETPTLPKTLRKHLGDKVLQ